MDCCDGCVTAGRVPYKKNPGSWLVPRSAAATDFNRANDARSANGTLQ